MHYQTIILKGEKAVALITLNRPQAMNSVNNEMRLELEKAITEVEMDASTRVLVITGAGNAFSAGADLNEFNELRMRGQHEKTDFGGPELALQFARFPKPIIAAINGAAVGWGVTMPVACDIRLASTKAKFGVPFVRVGLTPEFGSCYLLQSLIGYGAAAELFLTGRMIDANESLSIGLVNRVISHENLMSEALSIANIISAHPTEAVVLTKKLLRQGMFALSLEKLIEYEASVFQGGMRTKEHEDAVQALLAELSKKAPQ